MPAPTHSDIETLKFWREQRQKLKRDFEDITIEVVLAGAGAGLDMVDPQYHYLTDYDLLNTNALAFLNTYLDEPDVMHLGPAYSWANNLTQTTKNVVTKEIYGWATSGAPISELEKRLQPWFGNDRAHRVAVTEVTRVYAAGNVLAWQANEVVTGKRWRTAVDERVCLICGALHNSIIEVDAMWRFTREQIDANPELAKILKNVLVVPYPPAHVLCRCSVIPVVFEALSPEQIERDHWLKGGAPIVIAPPARKPKPLPVPQTPDTARRSEQIAKQLQAAGNKISTYLRPPKSGKYAKIYNRTLALIDRVHGDGTPPEVPIKTGGTGKAWGHYAYTWRGDPKEIAIKGSGGTHHELTLTHEIGHYLDHQAINNATARGESYESSYVARYYDEWKVNPDKFARTDEERGPQKPFKYSPLLNWWDAVRNSSAYKEFEDMRDNPQKYSKTVDLGNFEYTETVDRRFLGYLMGPEEVFARSYAQYIAEKSGDRQMIKQVIVEKDSRMYGAKQWDHDDFEPISRALDGAFEEMGWLGG